MRGQNAIIAIITINEIAHNAVAIKNGILAFRDMSKCVSTASYVPNGLEILNCCLVDVVEIL